MRLHKVHKMTSHSYNSYNTKNNSLASNSNNLESRSDKRPATPNTSELIINLEKKMLTRFDGLDKELLNIKDVIIKDLQIENQRLCSKINNSEKKVISLEGSGNLSEQYGRQKNLEIMGVPDYVEDKKLEKVMEILQKI